MPGARGFSLFPQGRCGDTDTRQVVHHLPEKHVWHDVAVVSGAGNPGMGGHPRRDLQDTGREQEREPELRKPVSGEARGLRVELEGRAGPGTGAS